MTTEEIISINIIDYLNSHGYKPSRHYGTRYWYHSPIHAERTASFKVDSDKNLWFDFGINRGGNIINLVKELNPNLAISEIFSLLEKEAKEYQYSYEINYAHASQQMNSNTIKKRISDEHNHTTILKYSELTHPNLIQYIKSRKIDISIASKYCKEIHYKVESTGKIYYAIAFENIEGGFEIRNKYSKRSIGRKNISWIKSKNPGTPRICCVFEGFFDFLSLLSYQSWSNDNLATYRECDFLILNSVNNVTKAINVLSTYNEVHCFLDNDHAGKDAFNYLFNKLSNRIIDQSNIYANYNDFNDYLEAVAEEGLKT